jgi:hypothetical protein
MRCEKLFNNIEGQPNQVIIRANALLNSLQIQKNPVPPIKSVLTPVELSYSGPRIFVDAAWKKTSEWTSSKSRGGHTSHLEAWPTHN